ncbi:hypothetical protein EC912_103478 [Luteibacter rhizovicinus]|uniref:BNR repeat protein n=1 Tax=Luteibacter rhizovicinus TaxID=242606 RepID=A0A4R3YQ03_9GAMM|nr:sialidase family protein [Luteibacter rhizovicinus]TCV94985.1 hypothetical protein EC912_103478 [Luteibacter rhizovicinus]
MWRRLLLLCLVPFAVAAQAHEGMAMDHAAMGGHTSTLGFGAALEPGGRLWVVDAAGQHIRVRHSDDMGRTLSDPVIVNPTPEPIYAEGENRPKIVLGPKGEIYVSWSQPRAKPYTGFVRFSRSLDGGAHFDAPVTVHTDRAEITHRFDSIAVDGKGRVVVAWIDKRDLEAATASNKPYLGAATYYTWSDDRGATFHPEKKITDQSCECCRIALAATPDGNIAAFFRAIYGDNIRDHAYALLQTDSPPVKAQRATFTQWHIEGCPHHGPSLAIAHDGTRHAVWFSAADGKATIWYGQLVPGKAPVHTLEVAGAGAAHADLAVAGTHVWIVYHQQTAEGLSLMLRESTDGGAHFTEAREIARTAGSAGWPQLLLRDGRAFVAWNTTDGFRLVLTELL